MKFFDNFCLAAMLFMSGFLIVTEVISPSHVHLVAAVWSLSAFLWCLNWYIVKNRP